MTQITKFHGVFPPVPTIVNAQGELDKTGMATLLDHLIASKVNGVLLLGSGGVLSYDQGTAPGNRRVLRSSY
jgi:4-hydroxy-tetrahydrodipicolinate synthase